MPSFTPMMLLAEAYITQAASVAQRTVANEEPAEHKTTPIPSSADRADDNAADAPSLTF